MITNEHFSGLPKLLQRIRSNPEDVKQSLRYVAFLGDLVKNSKIPVSPIFYVDASTSGNIGRIFNHSCDPNMFAQYVFVDTHDIRLPNLVFFAKRDIPSGEVSHQSYSQNEIFMLILGTVLGLWIQTWKSKHEHRM